LEPFIGGFNHEMFNDYVVTANSHFKGQRCIQARVLLDYLFLKTNVLYNQLVELSQGETVAMEMTIYMERF
jgi:hypothetical protein